MARFDSRSLSWVEGMRCALALALATPLMTSCLPGDTRPPPGRLIVVASGDDAALSGVAATETADAWTIEFERILVSMGHASAEGDECAVYSDPDYGRVLDMQEGGQQKLSVQFVRGTCEFDFELSTADDDSVLGAGVSKQDRTFMRTLGSDPFAQDSAPTLYFRGRAHKGAREKRFDWAYRRRIDYAACSSLVEGRRVSTIKVPAGAEATVEIQVAAGTLFQDQLEPLEARLGFEVFALADDAGDSNGDVTLAELDRVNADGLAQDRRGTAIQDGGFESLGQYLHDGLFPRVLRYQRDGTCEETEILHGRTPQ